MRTITISSLLLLGCASSSGNQVTAPSAAPSSKQPLRVVEDTEPVVEPADEQVTSIDWSRCSQILIAQEAMFRKKAPKLYPKYASLVWDNPPDRSEDLAEQPPYMEISPGRTWTFTAKIDWAEQLANDHDWEATPDQDARMTRIINGLELVVDVTTERSELPLSKHPLVRDFVPRFRKALDRCIAETADFARP